MRILQVTAHLRRGGMPLHVLTLADGLRRRGHEVGILSLGGGSLKGEFVQAGLDPTIVPILGDRAGRGPILAMNVARRVRQEIKAADPEIVHSHGPRAHFFAAPAARFAGRPAVVLSAHGSFMQFTMGNEGEMGAASRRLKRFEYGTIDRWAARFSNAVVAVSQPTARDLMALSIPWEKIRVIHNGIEEQHPREDSAVVRRALGLESDAKLVACIGRIAFHKGSADMVDAAIEVASEVTAARFVFAGDGPLEEELRSRVAAAGLQQKIIFTGIMDEVLGLIAASDLVVLPSLSEGLPLTLLEAAMLGRAMVATDVGGMPEVVRPGQTGYLVPPGSPRDLATSIRRLLLDDEERARMGKAARSLWREEFTAARMIDRMEELYDRVLATGKP